MEIIIKKVKMVALSLGIQTHQVLRAKHRDRIGSTSINHRYTEVSDILVDAKKTLMQKPMSPSHLKIIKIDSEGLIK